MKLKIGILTSTFLPSIGGSQIGLHVIAKSLNVLGHKIIVFVPFKTFIKLKRKKWILDYTVLPLPPKIFGIYYRYSKIALLIIKLYFKLINLFFKIDYCFANLAYPSGVMLSQLSENNLFKKNLVLCPGEDIQVDEQISYGIRLDKNIDNKIRKYLKQINHFIALTQSVKDEYIKLGVNNKKIVKIPYGIESINLSGPFDKFKLRKDLKLDDKVFIFLCVGRNHPKKNFELLIYISEELNLYTKQKYKILIVGKDVKLLKKLIKNKSLEENFILVDEIDNEILPDLVFPSNKLSKYYGLSDCFIFPSNLETFGIVLVEAMMAGLPIITSDAPGCRDVVENENHGLIFQRNDYKTAAKLMHKIMSDKKILEHYSINSIQRSKDFNSKNISLKYEDFFYQNLK